MSSLKNKRHFTTLSLVSCEMSSEKRARKFHHYPDLGSVSDSSFRDGNLPQPIRSSSTTQIWVVLRHQYCWFATDLTAAMLVHKNKTFSLRWEFNSFFKQIGGENFGTVIPHFTDIRLKRTLNYYEQFALFLGKESLYIFSKFIPLNTDASLTRTLSMAPSVSVLTYVTTNQEQNKPCSRYPSSLHALKD